MRISALSLLYIIVSFSHTSYSQIKRDIAFTIVDTPPRYSGCKGGNVAFLKECFCNKVTSLIAQNFDFE